MNRVALYIQVRTVLGATILEALHQTVVPVAAVARNTQGLLAAEDAEVLATETVGMRAYAVI